MSNSKWYNPHEQTMLLGSVAEVSATDIKINLQHAGKDKDFFMLGHQINQGNINQFVFIETGSYTLLAKITKIWLDPYERLSIDRSEDKTPSNHPQGYAQLLSSFKLDSGTNQKGIKAFPKLGAYVYAASPELLNWVSGSQKNGLDLATMMNNPNTPIQPSLEQLFQRHFAIVGTTGSGKSYSMAKVIEEVIQRENSKLLLIDPTGEFASFDDMDEVQSFYINPVGQNKTEIKFPHYDFTDSDLYALLKPSAGVQMPKLNEAIRSLRIVKKFKGQQNNLGGVLNGTNAVKENKNKQAFLEANSELTKEDKQWSFRALSDQIAHECTKQAYTNRGIDNTKWGATNEGDIGFCSTLISRINDLKDSIHFKWMTETAPSDSTIADMLEEFMATSNHNQDETTDKTTKVIRLDLSYAPFENHAREVLVNALGRKLLSLARAKTINTENPLLVCIDEAHQFLNKTLGEENAKFHLDAFGNIAKEGRKYGLNAIIATQRPMDIPTDVFSQIGTLLIHRLTNPRDQEVITKSVGTLDQRSAALLPSLATKEALLVGVDIPFPLPVEMKSPSCAPQSTSTKYSDKWPSSTQNN